MFRSWVKFLTVGLAVLLLASCAATDPQRYAQQKPALDLKRYFNGVIDGHGMVLDRSGEVTRRFVVTIHASWQGEVGTLDEDFVWSDGVKEKRVWTLRPGTARPVDRHRGRCGRPGQRHGGRQRAQLALHARLPDRRGQDLEHRVRRLDVPGGRARDAQRAVMSFWGFKVGEVLISFAPRK